MLETLLGNVGYLSWMSFRRYSVACIAPQFIRFAWLMRPLPSRMGITEVEAVLKETTSPSPWKGTGGEGRLLW